MSKYDKNTLLKGLIQLVPVGSCIDSAVTTHFNNIRQERIRVFFDELSEGKIELSNELIMSEDFLHAYFSTLKAAVNSRRHEKIILFAKLLKGSFANDKVPDIDDFEELLGILDEISYREILSLSFLYDFEVENSCNPIIINQDSWDKAKLFWGDFIERLVSRLNISEREVFNFLKRLERTGCYEVFIGMFGNDKNLGHLTPLYYRIAEIIADTK